MPDSSPSEVTRLVRDAGQGDPQAAAQLLPLVYEELRRLARARMAGERGGGTLQPTALVHEAFLRLVGDEDPGWNSRGHFFGAAARAMRNILVEQARRRASLKRGGDRQRVPADEADLAIEPPAEDLLALEEALSELEREDPRKGRIVMLHWFAGLTLDETAEVLETSPSTVKREWRFIRALLHGRLSGRLPES